MLHAKLVYDVALKFDGQKLYAANSNQGKEIKATILDVDGDGAFTSGTDQVLFAQKDGGKLSEANFQLDSATLARAAGPDGKLGGPELRAAGIGFAFDRNRDGAIEVNSSWLTRTIRKVENGLGEGAVTYNGQERISFADKEATGKQYFKDCKACLDPGQAFYREDWEANPQDYEAYSQHVDRARGVGAAAAVAGAATFLAAQSSHATGAFAILGVVGLMVAASGGIAASCAKLRPDLPVQY